MSFIVAFLAVSITIGLLDFIWLGFVAKKLYYNEIGKLLRAKPNMVAAVAFYVLYVIGVVVFVLNLPGPVHSLFETIGRGALFGLICYGTYDLTNLSTLKDFTKKLAAIDMVWGAILTAVAAGASHFILGIIAQG